MWLVNEALPLWTTAGFDSLRGTFRERLTLRGEPILDVPLRLMVQARQVYAYATAARRGWMSGAGEQALRGADAMISHWFEADGDSGWVTALNPDGKVADKTRDLYAHAFALLGLANAYGLSNKPIYLDVADRTMEFLDRQMAAPAGGYLTCLPVSENGLRQNPHMHLLEGLLALHEVAPDRNYGERARGVLRLFETRLLQRTGIVAEYFDEHWNPEPDDRGKLFEPGHHYEWVWLLDRAARLLGTQLPEKARDLIDMARLGCTDNGIVRAEVRSDGLVTDASYRLWPHTEAVKAALTAINVLAPAVAADKMLDLMWTNFLLPACSGGWHDRFDADGNLAVNFMPASSLYHIVCALSEYEVRRPML